MPIPSDTNSAVIDASLAMAPESVVDTATASTVHLEPPPLEVTNPPITIPFSQVQLPVRGSGKKVAIFCSSYSDIPKSYFHPTQRLATLLAQHGCSLIYGGGSWGLMGVVASTMEKEGCPAIVGILPSFMLSTAGQCYGQTVVVENMGVRKQLINQLADVVVVLPGGFGTMDEMTEMLTWNQIGYTNKLVAILNIDGYYDGWWMWCERAVKDGFIKPIFVENMIIASSPDSLIDQIMTCSLKSIPGKFLTKA